MASLRSAIIFITLLLALLHLLFFNIEPGSPIRQVNSGVPLKMQDALTPGDQRFLDAANGGNLALHFDPFDTADFHASLQMGVLFFRAVYTLYPYRVFVGHDDRVINFAPELAAADVLPDDSWLKSHGVRAVLQIHRSGYADVRPIP